jgi:hypothetical protein
MYGCTLWLVSTYFNTTGRVFLSSANNPENKSKNEIENKEIQKLKKENK